MIYHEKLKKYTEFINDILINRDIDVDDNDWKDSAEIRKLIDTNEDFYIANSVSIGINSSELLILIKVKQKSIKLEEVINCLKNEINEINSEDTGIFNRVNVLWIVDCIELRIKLKEMMSKRNANTIATFIRKSKSINGVIKIHSMIYLDKDIMDTEIKLNNIRRHEMLVLPSMDVSVNIPKDRQIKVNNKIENLKGYVLTVDLYDIVNLYNIIGDDLFKRNVRLGIEDQNNVDSAIKETLCNAPEYFWFRNNGVTILMEEPGFKLDRANEIVLKRSDSDKVNFSVINGAQTITAAAEYFFSDTFKKSDDSNNSKCAKIILRIIQIINNDAAEEAKKISIALNRQKPIKQEDIAYSNIFVEKFNAYLDSNNIGYSIVRRSEEQNSKNTVTLIDFARARKALAGYPGKARSEAANILLKINENDCFCDKDIFIYDWYTADENSEHELFDKNYRLVITAIRLADSYELVYKNLQSEDVDVNTIIKNGKWYFVAYVISTINDNELRFDNFDFNELFEEEMLKNQILKFAQFAKEVLLQENISINSNNLKNDDTYRLLKTDKSFSIKAILNISSSDINKEKQIKVTRVELPFLNDIKFVDSAADAFAYTIEKCLEYAMNINQDINKIVENTPCISVDNESNGYFRTKSEHNVNGIKVFIGRHHNFAIKTAHINNFCRLVGLSKGSVVWKDGTTNVYENK